MLELFPNCRVRLLISAFELLLMPVSSPNLRAKYLLPYFSEICAVQSFVQNLLLKMHTFYIVITKQTKTTT